jgi:hypothetical protein
VILATLSSFNLVKKIKQDGITGLTQFLLIDLYPLGKL